MLDRKASVWEGSDVIYIVAIDQRGEKGWVFITIQWECDNLMWKSCKML